MNNQSLELFCGTKSFSKVAKKHSYKTTTTDINPSFNPDIVASIFDLSFLKIDFDII